MTRHSWLIAAAALIAVPSAVQAQSSSLFGNRGVNASSGTLNNGVGAGNNAGGGSFGNSGAMTGFTGATAGSQQGFASGAATSGGLAGTGNNGNFVGNRNSAASGTGSNGAGAANRGRTSLNGGLSRNSNSQRNRGNQARGAANGAQSTPIRPVQVIAFTPPERSGASIQASLGADISSAATQGRIPGVAVEVDNLGTATIHGHVASESDRKKAERLVQLEPGVRKVVNRVTVAE
ncbi:BON domain protein [Caulifigura coniformis]|uniref:BON domain protein n=1 Tax=Caulifigura coniformis TaxID=2527983 RepID=A0A517SA11_9PLAN|nr:BON domain-containing protein [Caulifigura coniformis]QDT52967.1 BON domain protein [Caulifigura coniformis]